MPLSYAKNCVIAEDLHAGKVFRERYEQALEQFYAATADVPPGETLHGHPAWRPLREAHANLVVQQEDYLRAVRSIPRDYNDRGLQ